RSDSDSTRSRLKRALYQRHTDNSAVAPTTQTPTSAAAVGLRFAQRTTRSKLPTGRASVGSPAKKRRKSCVNAKAEAYRRRGSFSRHFMQIAPRSRGIPARNFARGVGSVCVTRRKVSRYELPAKTILRVSSSYKIAPRL